MTDCEILDRVGELAREHIGWEGDLSPSMRLVEDLELDSLKALTLVVEVENQFRIRLEPEVEAGIATMSDLVKAIQSYHND